MKITLEQTYRPEADRYLAGNQLTYLNTRTVTRDALAAAAADADVLMLRWSPEYNIDRELLQQLTELKLLHKSGSGLERIDAIDTGALTDLGILFTNNSGLNAGVVAEHAILLTLLCLRPDTVRQLHGMRRGQWDQEPAAGIPRASTLEGKVVGIVGVGQIGTNLAIRYRAMGVARILGYQRHPRFEHSLYGGVEWVSLAELMATADVIALCLPINDSTRGLIGSEEIKLMRPSTVVVNVGRGGVIDEDGLYEALATGRIRAAGLDVFADEPTGVRAAFPAGGRLSSLPNVFATPHMAGTAVEMQARQIRRSVEIVRDFVERRRPPGLANNSVLDSGRLRAAWLRRTIGRVSS